MLSFTYTTSKGVTYDMMTDERFISESNAFDYAFAPVKFSKRFGAKIYGFEMEPKEFEATLYVFGSDRKTKIDEITSAFDMDVLNETPGTITCNGYSIEAYSIACSDASVNSSALLWDTFKRKFICPYPFWSKKTGEYTFINSIDTVEPVDVKDYMPTSPGSVADYPWDYLAQPMKHGVFTNADLGGSEWQLIIDGHAEQPVIFLGDNEIRLDVVAELGEKIIIDSRAKSIVLIDANNNESNIFGYRNVAVDIFTRIPKGTVNVYWDNIPKWSLITYDERTMPLWT